MQPTIPQVAAARRLILKTQQKLPMYMGVNYAVEQGCLIVETRFGAHEPERRFKVNIITDTVEELT